MDYVKAVQIAALMVSPTVIVGIALHTPRLFRAAYARVRERSADSALTPRNAPIEELAADLRRLLFRHDILKRSPSEAMRARRLVALEAAVADCAADAAKALGVAYPQRPTRGALPVPQLRRLLRALVDAGLVLPLDVDLVDVHRRDSGPGVATS